MRHEYVIVPDSVRYLSDFIDVLPSHKLINKGITGCGGTTLELKAKRNSLLLFPTIELVRSKTNPEYLPVDGDVDIYAIRQYVAKRLSNNQFIKIIGTYDSLPKIMQAVPGCTEYFLLIDEYHLLFNDYSFRSKAILNILINFRKFDDWAFLTATPLNETFTLKELEDIDQITYQWPQATKVDIKIKDTAYIQRELVRIITSYPERNIHVFLNSVSTIRNIIKKLGTDDFRVVCSSKQRGKIKHCVPITEPVRKLNFYTSCSFEGCDIYDEKGMTVILSDTSLSTTILDISTKIRQVCGRIRNSKYKDECILVLNTRHHRYANVSKNQFDDFSAKMEAKGKDRINLLTGCSEMSFCTEVELYGQNKIGYNNIYVNFFNSHFFYDENLKKIDLYNYMLVSEIYNSTLTVITEYKRHNFNVSDELMTKINSKGLPWVVDIIEQTPYKEWTYTEIENRFKNEFNIRGLNWNHSSVINTFFPPYEKIRKRVNGKRESVYVFSLSI